MDLCLAAKDKLTSNFSFFLLLFIMFIWFGIITANTLPNIFVPMIKPTLKKANFGPNNFVKPNEIKTNNIKIIEINKKLFFIKLDLHNTSYANQEIIIEDSDIRIALKGEITKTFLSTIKMPAL